MEMDYLASKFRPVHISLGIIGIALSLAVLLLVDASTWKVLSSRIDEDHHKILFQFLLITSVGGGVFAFVAAIKDEQARRERWLQSAQVTEREMSEVYRAMKRSKRLLRSRLVPGRGFQVTAEDFRASMDELLGAQIRAEALEDDLPSRIDLFDAERLSQLGQLLHYAARYLHDVYEDFEKARVRVVGDIYVIAIQREDGTVEALCSNLIDFVDMPDRVAGLGAMPRDVEYILRRMKAGGISLAERISHLDEIERIRKTFPHRPRYTKIAYECFRIAVAEVRNAAHEVGSSQRPLRGRPT